MPDNLTAAQRSYSMSRIGSKNTQPELRLRKALWATGLRGYRIHSSALPGKPDIVWHSRRVAVFVDGAFWHGHRKVFRPGKSGSYWDLKIAANKRRDRRVSRGLRAQGWQVLRFWDFEIERDADDCVNRISQMLGLGENRAPDVVRLRHNMPESNRRTISRASAGRG